MPYARLVELLECAHLEERRMDLRAAMSGGMLTFDKYTELQERLTRGKLEVDEDEILRKAEGNAAKFGEMRKVRL